MIRNSALKGLMVLVLVSFLSTACSSEQKSMDTDIITTEEVTTESYEATPQEKLDEVETLIEDEMRVFDVNLHHDTLHNKIKSEVIGLEDEEAKLHIATIVTDYMDVYFKERIRELLFMVNESYSVDEVETLFDNTSRASLYELIVLYEWTYYQKSMK